MRICLYQHYYLPLFSGAAIRAHQQARIASQQGHKVWVLTPRYPGLKSQESIDGIPVVRTCIFGSTRNQRFLTFGLSASWELILRRNDYDLIHFFNLSVFEIFPLIVAKALSKKILYQMTMMPPKESSSRRIGVFLARRLYRLVDGAVVISTPLFKILLKRAELQGLPIAIIFNGVDISTFRPMKQRDKKQPRRKLGLNPLNKYICFVGSVVERKGVDVLISAFEQVANRFPEACLLIVGPDKFGTPGGEKDEGYQRAQGFADRMKRYVEDLGLAERVIFTGKVNPERVPLYLHASDIFVFPSRREGFGSVIVQAMATGLPSIVSDLNGIAADIITSGVDGYIVQGLDSSTYAKFISRLLSNPAEAERIGRAARRTVEEKFQIEHIVNQYILFYEKLINSTTNTKKSKVEVLSNMM